MGNEHATDPPAEKGNVLPLDYRPQSERVRGAHPITRITAGLATVVFVGVSIHLYLFDTPFHDHPYRIVAPISIAGAAFLGCLAAGIVGSHLRPPRT